jgi:hypothetical protein
MVALITCAVVHRDTRPDRGERGGQYRHVRSKGHRHRYRLRTLVDRPRGWYAVKGIRRHRKVQ